MTAHFTRLLAVFSLMSCLPLFADDPAGADAEKTCLLRYRFHDSEIVGYKVDHQTEVTLHQQEAEQHVEHGSVTNKRYTVRKVDEEGNAVLDLQIDRVRMTAAVDGGESVDYDTASGGTPPSAFQGINETVGKPHVRVKVSPRGELLSLDWLIATNQRTKPTIENASELDILVLLPDEAIKVGDTWKETFEVEIHAAAALKKSVKIQREYTLQSVDGTQATIALKTVVLTPLHDPAQEVQLVSKTPRGTVTFDLARGVVTSRTQQVDKAIVGFAGDDSRSRTISTRTEELAPVQVSLETGGNTVVR
jgi:hypothetical protein